MSIRTRLALGIIAIALILAVPLLSALGALDRLHGEMSDSNQNEFAASLLLGRMRATTEELRARETALAVLVTEEPVRCETAERPRCASHAALAAEISRLVAMADSLSAYTADSASALVQTAVDRVEIAADPHFEAALGGRVARLDSLSDHVFRPALARVDQAIGSAERSIGSRARQRIAAVAAATERAWEMSALMLMLATVLVAAIAIWLTRSISRPVRALETGMRRVAGGDFTHRLPIRPDRSDEFGELASSFASMAEQLAQLDRIKAEFMSVASHELKTPLNVIIGYLQLLDEGLYGELTPRQREICGTLRTQANSLARLVQQLLDVSRFEAGAARIEPRDIELPSFLGELERAFEVLTHQRGIDFGIHLGDALPPTVRWDPDRMNEVLGNLLSNAFKFTERGGRVELSVEHLRDGDAEGLQLEVRDTGAGIPAEQLPQVFEKFFQADNQARAAHAGTGLGLAISKQIVEAHHGVIECDSTVGVGTTFVVILPVSAERPVKLPRRAFAASEAI